MQEKFEDLKSGENI